MMSDDLVQANEWLKDYLLMMELTLGATAQCKTEGVYEGSVERILEVRAYFKRLGIQPHSFPGLTSKNATLL